MHLINQGVPRQRRMLRVLAPTEELIPMAPIPAIWKRAHLSLKTMSQKQNPNKIKI
jgi:hypothetical protein